MTEPTRPCGTCGMPCTPGEYHPYAACLMFKACHNSETVRANLEAVRATTPAVAGESGEIAQQLEYLLLETENKQHPHMGAVAFLEACEAFILDHGADILNLLSGGPSQAQAGAVPLTDEQRNAIYDKHCFLGDNGWEIDWWKVIDEVEAAHRIGIKNGDSHGLKT